MEQFQTPTSMCRELAKAQFRGRALRRVGPPGTWAMRGGEAIPSVMSQTSKYDYEMFSDIDLDFFNVNEAIHVREGISTDEC
jgi:hypothetical protein